ncbi:MAG: hypothetical protein AAF235_06055, partial [Planctomycetota bacterium]
TQRRAVRPQTGNPYGAYQTRDRCDRLGLSDARTERDRGLAAVIEHPSGADHVASSVPEAQTHHAAPHSLQTVRPSNSGATPPKVKRQPAHFLRDTIIDRRRHPTTTEGLTTVKPASKIGMHIKTNVWNVVSEPFGVSESTNNTPATESQIAHPINPTNTTQRAIENTRAIPREKKSSRTGHISRS